MTVYAIRDKETGEYWAFTGSAPAHGNHEPELDGLSPDVNQAGGHRDLIVDYSSHKVEDLEIVAFTLTEVGPVHQPPKPNPAEQALREIVRAHDAGDTSLPNAAIKVAREAVARLDAKERA